MAIAGVKKEPDWEKINRRVKDELSPSGRSANVNSATSLGYTIEAAFSQMTGATAAEGMAIKFKAIVAMTVINQLPVAIYSFGSDDTPLSMVAPTARSYLRLTLDKS